MYGELKTSIGPRWAGALAALLLLALTASALLTPTPRVTSAQTAGGVTLAPALSGFDSPLFLTHAGDGSGRLFVVERGGTIRVVVGGQVQPEPFLDISSLVNAGGFEQGLLGLAFHPNYEANGIFYVYYTANASSNSVGDNTLARYRVSSSDPNQADPGSAAVLFALQDDFNNHNGGMVAFGPDGYLYVGTGDGGSAGDPDNNAQNLGSLLGKILRLDLSDDDDGVDNDGAPYAIPASNPFVGQGGARPEIWALGLRNPWRFGFDRQTGDLWIGDVGQGGWEEINRQPAGSPGGENYEWRCKEGSHPYDSGTTCSQGSPTAPVHDYDHSGGSCSVTGGYVYRGPSAPSLHGAYLFGDYCSGRVWSLRQGAGGTWTETQLFDTPYSISSFGEDATGEVYAVDIVGGRIYRFADATTPTPGPSPTANRTPTRTATPSPAATLPPGSVTVTFDDRAGENQLLEGEYPSGIIDWGTGEWYHSGP
ncbi:MAG: PQQ-dependent sugar dehydrogenase, partial [Chloroflexota bacterium]